MSTSTSPTPPPAPDAGAQPQLSVVPPPGRRGRPPLALNTAQLTELNRAALICKEAQKPEFMALLQAHDVPATFVTALLNDIATASARSIDALLSTNSRKSASVNEDVCEDRLVKSLRNLQSAAVHKHRDSDPARIGDYLVGQPIDDSRPLLEQSAQAIITKANEERPPGVDTGVINRVQGERDAYVQSETVQRDEQANAKAERVARNALVRSIKQRRIKIQLAAETAWPASGPENGAIRTKFFLQPDRPYRPRRPRRM